MADKENRMAGVKKYNAAIKKQNEKRVYDAINKLRKEGEFTLADLCREANVSRSYFRKNPEMRELADKYITPTGYTKNRDRDSQDTIIQVLKKENKELNGVISHLKKEKEKETSYEQKYKDSLEEIKKLKKEIEGLYSLYLPDHN